MTPTKIKEYIQPYRQLKWSDALNCIHVAQKIYQEYDAFNIEEEIKTTKKQLSEVGKHLENIINLTDSNPNLKPDFSASNNLMNSSYGGETILISDQKNFCLIQETRSNLIDEAWLFITKNQEQLQRFINFSQYLIFLKSLQSTISNNNQVVEALAKLIYYQNNDVNQGKLFDQTTKEQQKIKDVELDQLITRLKKNINDGYKYDRQQITIGRLANLIAKLQKHQLLDKVQATWLLEQNAKDIPFVKDFVADYKLDQKLIPCAKIPTELTTLVKELEKKKQVLIFEIKNQNKAESKNIKKFIGIHGTKPFSVPPIVNEGLKNYESLKQEENSHYSYTGSGLGTGVYFARLEQFQKALNYSDQGQVSNYLFVGEVYYHKAKIVKRYGEYQLKDDEDLIVGKEVGSYNRDEIVVPNDNQINTKYLIELLPK